MTQLNLMKTLCETPHKRVLPLLLGIVASFAILLLGQQLTVLERHHIEQLIQQKANAIESEIGKELSIRMVALQQMANRWEANGGTAQALWEADAHDYIKNFYGYQAIEWVDPSFKVQWVVPLAGNEAAQNLNLSWEPHRQITLQVARDLRQIILTHNISLVQGGKGFLATVPLFVGNRFDGFILGVFQFQRLFDSILKVPEGYGVAIYDRSERVYNQGVPSQCSFKKTVIVEIYGADWRVEVFPTPALIAEVRSPLAMVVLIGGLVLVWLFVLVVNLAQISYDQIHRFKQANHLLQWEIYQRQQAEAAITRLAAIVESSEDAIIGKDLEGIVTSWNLGAERIFGYKAVEMVGQSERILIPAADREQENKMLAKIQQGEVIEHYETKQLRKDGTFIDLSISISPIKDENGNIIGASKIARNITERKQAEASLSESESRYRQLINNLNAGVVVHAPDTNVLLCNSTACHLLGLSMEQMLGKTAFDPAWHFVSEDGTALPVEQYPVNQVLSTGLPLKNQIIGINRSILPLVWVLINAYPEYEPNGQLKQVVITFINISERKQAEEAIQQTRNFLQTVLDHLPVSVFVKDTRPERFGVFQFWNKTSEQLLGLTAEQVFGKTVYDLFPLEQAQFFEQKDREAIEKAQVEDIPEEQIDSYNLGKRWLHTVKVPLYDQYQQPQYLLCFSEDITHRKQAEAELREKSEVLANAVSGISKLDPQGQYLYVNKAYADITGYQPEEMIGMAWQITVYPDDLEKLLVAYRQMVEHGRVEVEAKGIRKDGSVFYKQLVMIATYDEQHQLLGHYCFMKDISDRKNAEVALEQELMRTKTLFNTSFDGIVVMNHQGDVVEASPSFAKMIGYTLEEILRLNTADWDAQWTREELDEIRNRKKLLTPVFETRHRRKDGSIYDAEISYSRVELNGEMLHFCICRDISDRKKAEQALRESEEKFRTAIDFTYDWEYWVAPDDTFVYLSPSCERVTGFSQTEFIQNPGLIDNIIHPDDRALIENHKNSASSGVGFADFRIITRTGEIRWIAHTCQLVFSSDGQYLGKRVSNRDISDRKRAEEERQQAEFALRESEARFQAFMNHSPAPAWITDANGVIIYANQTYIQTFQTLTDTLIGKSVFEVYPVAVAQNFLENIQTVVNTKKVIEVLEIAPRRDGTQGDFFVYKFPIPDSSGQTLVGGVGIDMTHQHQVEEALRQSEATKQAIMEAIPDLLIQMRSDGTYLDFICNRDFKLFSPEKIRRNANLYEILPPELSHLRIHYTQQALASGITQVYEHEILIQGNQRYEEVRIVPLHQDEVLIMVRDITARKQAEVELRHQKEMFQAIVNHIPVMISLFNAEGQIEFINPELERILGWSLANCQQEDVLAKCFPNPLERQLVQEHMLSATGKWRDMTALTASGQPIETSWANVRLSNGKFLGIGQDISDRKRKEQALRQAMEAAEEANQAKSIFLANMSHELRTPLNVILGFAQVMAHDPSLTPHQKEDLQTIHRSGDHLLNLINDILDLSKIESGHCTTEESEIDLILVLNSLRNMLAERASSKGLDLCLEIAPEVPQFILTDCQKLRQVLLNLLSNAIKFTNRGRITLQVGVKDANPEAALTTQQVLHFAVTDTGVGIASEELTMIFDAFVQAQAGKRAISGSGLGLTISRKLLELMGGEIAVSSIQGKGSTFTFTLPVTSSSGVNVSPEESDRLVIGLAPNQALHRILVVDDRAENRLLMVRLLTQLGLEVREAANGQEAVQLWQEWQPRLIWMDIRMPVLDGYEATKQIRAMESGQPSVIIALTAQASQSDRSLAIAAGCNDYISKPFREQTLLLKMAEYLNLEYLYAEPSRLPHPLASSTSAQDDRLECLNPTVLATLSETWLAQLEEATVCGDDVAIVELVAQLPPELTGLTTYLTQLADQYQFERILKFIQSSLHPAE